MSRANKTDAHPPLSTKTSPRLLKREEVAEILNVSVGTLDRWRAERTGPPVVKFGATRRSPIRYPSDGLDAFIAAHALVRKT